MIHCSLREEADYRLVMQMVVVMENMEVHRGGDMRTGHGRDMIPLEDAFHHLFSSAALYRAPF